MKIYIEGTSVKILKVFDSAETFAIEKQWMDIFCKNKQGFNTKAFKWHIFSGGGYPSINNNNAMLEFLKHTAPEYIVMANNKQFTILTDSKPVKCNLSDYYIFPTNMAWTMAFTHEDGWLGPYFATHPNYKNLNEQNQKYKHKLREIEIAKKNGWC